MSAIVATKREDAVNYPKLPVMQCDPNCGECCGPVLCTEHEFENVETYAGMHNVTPIAQGSTCPFYQGGECKVYDVRPFVCRLFGHSPRLVCCKGYNRNIPSSRERKLSDKYGTPTRFLHEFLGTGWRKEMLS